MLDLTNTQAKIIGAFIDNYRDKSNKISIGLTANELEKYGIKSKTFRNHKDYFLRNYFLRLSATGFHGKRNYYYFQITRFGVLAYLKWSAKQKFPFEFELDKDFFPLLWKHWDELVKFYGDVFPDILQKAIICLEIGHQYVYAVRGKDVTSSKVTEVLTVPMGIAEIKIFTGYPEIKIQEIPTDKIWRETKHFQTLNQNIDDKITERHTFLVYYNLLESGLAGDFSLMFNHVTSKFLLKKDPTESDLDDAKRETVEFAEKMKQNTDKLFTLIKKDKELYRLMKTTLAEVVEVMNNRKPLKTMVNRLG